MRGVEPRYSQSFRWGDSAHEVGVGYRYVSESTHELRYTSKAGTGRLPSTASPYDRDTQSGTEAHAFYIDDRIDIGDWTITPGMRYEYIKSYQNNYIKNNRLDVSYNAPLPALNVMYHLNEYWNLYANTEGSFGTVQYSQMGKAVDSGKIEPEKARTWELGTRYAGDALTGEIGLFLINFNNQYDSNQVTDSVTARGKTRHAGLEGSLRYDLSQLTPKLDDLTAYASYAYVNATIREDGGYKAIRCRSRRSIKARWGWTTRRATGRLTLTASSNPASSPTTPTPWRKAPTAAPAAFPAICCGACAPPMISARKWPV